ncbi:MAG: HAD family hydrolase [Opitutales bacterium]
MGRWAAIFDWDGVILDSRAAHAASWERLAAEIDRPLPPDHMERGFGRRNASIIPEILHWSEDPAEIERLGERKEALYRKILAGGTIEPLPGVRDLLQGLQDAEVPCAVGSSTARANIEVAMKAMELEPFFAAIASGEDVENGKPAPDVFLLAAERLGVEPARCIVLEDAPFGVEAALAGGMLSIGVATDGDPDKLSAAHRVVASPAALSVHALEALLRAQNRLP